MAVSFRPFDANEEKAAVPPLPLTLAARLLPVAVLATAGWAMTAQAAPEAGVHPAASGPAAPAPDAAKPSAAGGRYAKAPDPCPAVPDGTVKDLVPGAETGGKKLESTDAKSRTGCSWHALNGYDYRWLDVTFEVSPEDGAARQDYADRKQPTAAPGLGDEASVGSKTTQHDGQQTRETVVVVRKANAVMAVTYSGSNFETHKAPGAGTMREDALKAAKQAVSALDH